MSAPVFPGPSLPDGDLDPFAPLKGSEDLANGAVRDYGEILLEEMDALKTREEKWAFVERLHGVDLDALAMALGRRHLNDVTGRITK